MNTRIVQRTEVGDYVEVNDKSTDCTARCTVDGCPDPCAVVADGPAYECRALTPEEAAAVKLKGAKIGKQFVE
jgi:hypothetical protein